MNDTYITFRGWLGGDVETRELSGGHRLARMRVGSTPRRRRGEQWEDAPTIWYTVKAWDGLADHAAASLAGGQPVLVHGKLEADVWTAQDGSTQVRYVVTAMSLGHDLTRGTSVFTRRAATTGAEQTGQDGRTEQEGPTGHDEGTERGRETAVGEPVAQPRTPAA